MRGFGDLEAPIMDVLWERGTPTSVREIWSDLRQRRDLAYNTVLTVVDNLFKKGWLTRQRAERGRAFHYLPTLTRTEYGARLMRDAMAESGDPAGSLAGFVRELSHEESAALRTALAEYDR